jgi:hypothetical protein
MPIRKLPGLPPLLCPHPAGYKKGSAGVPPASSNIRATLTGGTVSDNGTERTVIDTEATEGKKFYRVQVNKP